MKTRKAISLAKRQCTHEMGHKITKKMKDYQTEIFKTEMKRR